MAHLGLAMHELEYIAMARMVLVGGLITHSSIGKQGQLGPSGEGHGQCRETTIDSLLELHDCVTII